MKLYKIINEHKGWENWKMVKIESCFCETTLDARKRERYWYEELNANTMNTIRPMCTTEEAKENSAEYYINNRAKINERNTQYYNDNKAEINEKHNQYKINNKKAIASNAAEEIHCEACNCYNSRCAIAKHNKTKKHLNNLKLENTQLKNDKRI
jgi:hypothetical protein